MMGNKNFLLAIFIFGIFVASNSEARRAPSSESSDLFERVRDSLKQQDLKKAKESLEEELSKNPKGETLDLFNFQLAYVYFLDEQYEKSATHFKQLLELKSKIEEYARYYLAQNYLKLGQDAQAEVELRKLEKLSPNLKLKNESQLSLATLMLRQKKFKEARTRLGSIEKRARGTELYPELIFQLALAEKGLQNSSKACSWARKLYIKYPTFSKVQDWGADLYDNKLNGEKTQCGTGLDDFKNRVRYLMWAGLDDKALSEINTVKSRLAKESPFLADGLQAQYYLQEGEPRKAIELLKPHFALLRTNFNFMMMYASASARAGEVQLAVGTYYEAYKINPKSKEGRQALYQSAFLSYQFQDYDGAGRRFREFLKVYPRSGLTRDAEWNLAWLQYLKGDFNGAYQSLSRLSGSKSTRRRNISDDRIEYWRAMCLYRLGKISPAKSIFERLSKDKLLGYYSIASQSRLKKISTQEPPRFRGNGESGQRLTRFSNTEFLIASPVGNDSGSLSSEEGESEENVVMNQIPSEEEEGEAAESDPVQEHGRSEVNEAEVASEFKSPDLAQRFEKARDLMIVGLDDWAKWDLFEIEKKTKNRDYLRTLMSEYSTVAHFNRSSYIGQVIFAPARAAQGLEGVRFLWEFAYPKAYGEFVENSASEFNIPSELIWGIMKAESQYRRDAISPVGALGLMQVMPFTGKKVSQQLGQANFKATELLNPPTAIRIGSKYLSRLMQKFDQTIPFVAASYNAGPHRVKTWLAYFGTLEMDEFVEHIPFLETRNYVKKVISNSFVYAQLYGQKKELPLNLSDPIKIRVDPSFVSKESWDEI